MHAELLIAAFPIMNKEDLEAEERKCRLISNHASLDHTCSRRQRNTMQTTVYDVFEGLALVLPCTNKSSSKQLTIIGLHGVYIISGHIQAYDLQAYTA